MATFVRMPQKGLTEESAILSKWYVAEGDVIKEGQYLFAMETGKAAFEVEAESSGTILKLFAGEGDEVLVKKIICVIGNPGESFTLPDDEVSSVPASSDHAPPVAAAPSSAVRLTETPKDTPKESPPPALSTLAVAAKDTSGGGKISPRARRLALVQGLDYRGVSGTGPGGRVIEEDIKAALGSRPAQTLAASVSFTRSSAPSTDLFTIHARCDVSELLAYRERWNSANTPEDKLTVNDLAAFAVSRVLPRFPRVNAHFGENETLSFTHVNLGFAVNTPRGLFVPVVKNADSMSLVGLSREIKTLAGRCHDGEATSADPANGTCSNATFTLSSMGGWGADFFTPAINPPQVASLGLGTIEYGRKKTDAGFTDYPALPLSLAADRRLVDDACAAAFLKAVREGLEHFSLLLLL